MPPHPHQISSNRSSLEHASLGGAGAGSKGLRTPTGCTVPFLHSFMTTLRGPSTLLSHFTEEADSESTCPSLPRDGEGEGGRQGAPHIKLPPNPRCSLGAASTNRKRPAHQVSHLPELLHFRMSQSFFKNSSNSGSSALRSWLPSMAEKTAAPTNHEVTREHRKQRRGRASPGPPRSTSSPGSPSASILPAVGRTGNAGESGSPEAGRCGEPGGWRKAPECGPSSRAPALSGWCQGSPPPSP